MTVSYCEITKLKSPAYPPPTNDVLCGLCTSLEVSRKLVTRVYLQSFFALKALHGICEERGAIVSELLHSRYWRSRNGCNGCFRIDVVIIKLDKTEPWIVHIQYITHCLLEFFHACFKFLRVPKMAHIGVLHVRVEYET